VRKAIERGCIEAAHDVADGGLFVSLLEMAMPNELGFDVVTDDDIRLDAFLFGEGQGRIVVSCSENQQDRLLVLLGHVTKGKIMVDNTHFGFCAEWRNTFENALEEELMD
jgi:phosphoribosylformylglycinamidine synthase subunit PurL